ncbi:MAG: hydroxyacid dehydrogenase [Alphaproteobacteria bacterium]|nr:hydroxyacid dehydrogenase [Alphaproteobacteria bacterium]
MKVIFHYDVSPGLAARLAALSAEGLDVAPCPEADDARFAALMEEAEVLWHVLRPVTAAHIAAAPCLRLIQKVGVGVNTIDLEAAKRAGIAVCNMPGTNSQAVAEMTLLLMLAALRCLPLLHEATRAGQGWALPAALPDRFGELAGRTVGLVGFGAIPRLLAPALLALGAKLAYTARAPKAEAPPAARFLPLPDLLAQADILSLHVPLLPETARMIDAAALAAMKPGAILVNTARGGLVDQPALVAALRSGRLAAAGLDVFAEEPVPAGEALLQLPNVVLAPHIAWLTGGTIERSLGVAVENCRRLRAGAGGPLLHRVA